MDRDEAEDIVQHTFVHFWEQREQLEVHTSARSMLYKAVHNACLNSLKHKKVRQVYRRNRNMQAHNRSGRTISSRAKELETQLEAVIDRLPEQCARIFKMSRLEGLKYQEIANQLQLSVKTVENQMGKALRILREELKAYLPLLLLF